MSIGARCANRISIALAAGLIIIDIYQVKTHTHLARRGKFGVVIEAICRDLGLVPSLVTEQQWSELADAIIAFGGNFAGLIGDVFIHINQCILDASFSEPLSGQAIRALNDAVFLQPAPA